MNASLTNDAAKIAELVDVAIERARTDSLMGSIFERDNDRGESEWAAMRSAWTALLAGGSETPAHMPKLEPTAFARWLAILYGVAAELFEPATADAFSESAERVVGRLEPRLFISNSPTRGR